MPGSNDSFPILRDSRQDDHSLPSFMVSSTRGFLPRDEPVEILPEEFAVVESLLARMPIRRVDGTPGLLAKGDFGDAVLHELQDLSNAIDKYARDLPLMNALYRDYTFLASAYLLEPCHLSHMRGEGYGLGRNRLPASIARPIAKVAEM
jgi:indoleamine 2,3-dioxygenase